MFRFIGSNQHRFTIIKNATSSLSHNRSISYEKLTITRIRNHDHAQHKNIPKNKKDLQFGKVFSDHMLQIPYKKSMGGWQNPEIVPYHDLKLSPAATSLHYGKQETKSDIRTRTHTHS